MHTKTSIWATFNFPLIETACQAQKKSFHSQSYEMCLY
jgi:hypothetical protein